MPLVPYISAVFLARKQRPAPPPAAAPAGRAECAAVVTSIICIATRGQSRTNDPAVLLPTLKLRRRAAVVVPL
ncbi:hypothetical protein EVAR_89034_1 [Eumeta japonica]|uniref:Uncharacterized protein n=1 Tax=Eumeta variegata TaxID=151549 RepID=A0A4C1Z016_EUMVA|nr:hypothetical protein EVAR_89034_1 [Eumeta japonica]